MAIACVKLKPILQNIVIRDGPGTPLIFKIELVLIIA